MLKSMRRIILDWKDSILLELEESVLYGPVLLAFFVGSGIPLLFVHFAEDSWNICPAGVFCIYWIATAVFTHALFRRAGNRVPTIKQWAVDSVIGVTVLCFIFGLIVSGVAVLFVLLPVPWAATAVFTCSLFRSRRVGNRVPTLKQWVAESVALTVVCFIFGLIFSGVVVLFADTPVPYWLNLAIAFGFCVLVVFGFMVGQELEKHSKKIGDNEEEVECRTQRRRQLKKRRRLNTTVESAIPMHADSRAKGIAKEHDCLKRRFAKQGEDWGVNFEGVLTEGNRIYDILLVKFPNGEKRKVYFDITSCFGKLGRVR